MMGHKLRRFRQQLGLSQTEMAEQIGISPSYFNLIEHNQRPLTVQLLFRMGQSFDIDLKEFAEDDDARLAATLGEVFGDPLFDGQSIGAQELREMAAASPQACEAVLSLYRAYRGLWEDTQALADRMSGGSRPTGQDGQAAPADEVRDVQQSHSNYFPSLEAAAEELWDTAKLAPDQLDRGISQHLQAQHDIRVKILPVDVMGSTLRRFDHHGRRILLSEILPPSGRAFQLISQVALLSWRETLDRIIDESDLSTDLASRLMRVALANYFAAAVMMPYELFLAAARDLRYDIDVLGCRFGASFEQVCHRLTTLQRPGARGVSFFFMRADNAGNVSKRLSAGGLRFARFGGTCPRWIVHDAFRTPGRIHRQLAEMPDGTRFFALAKTVEPIEAWPESAQPRLAVALGCDVRDAEHLVYADGLVLQDSARATPVGVNCRVCEHLDCVQRAYPPLNHRWRVDENVRRNAPFTIVTT